VGIATFTSFISFHGRDEMHTSDHCLHPTKDPQSLLIAKNWTPWDDLDFLQPKVLRSM